MIDIAGRRNVKASRVGFELLPEQSTAVLKELHLLTRDGHLNADALRKLKQVNHLVGLLRPAIEDVQSRHPATTVVDVGSGSGYLPFVLYELFFKQGGEGRVVGVEARPELVTRAAERAGRLGFDRLNFVEGSIEAAAYPERLHLLTALHACDTATDDALAVALARKADWVAVVPCCQAEVARQLKETRTPGPMAELHAHAWHRREFGSHLTNVIRALVLEASGYQVTVTELAGWEHSLKNELILARRVHADNRAARRRLDALLAATGVRPKIVRTLGWAPPGDAAPETGQASDD
jgi:SAM-dependent methyltransferase